MFGSLTLAVFAATLPATGRSPSPLPLSADHVARILDPAGSDRPRINIWNNHDDPYRRGERARIYFRTDADAYVTILRVDTDGRLRVLFPEDPWEDNYARGGRTLEVLSHTRDDAFGVDDYPGVGYIFAVASYDPFVYDDLVRNDRWDLRTVSDGRLRGDPYVALTDLASRIAAGSDYDYDVAQYDVEQHYDYPRFLCYDCHTYASYSSWDPYDSYCPRFRIEIYDDFAYYPYRYYGGRNVVISRPARLRPRYVFKDNDGRTDYVTRLRERPREPDARWTVDGRTSADVGGPGSVPVPIAPRIGRETDVRPGEPNRATRDLPVEPRTRPGARENPSEPQVTTPREGNERRERSPAREPERGAPPARSPGNQEPRRESPRREEPKREPSAPRAEPRQQKPKAEAPPPKPPPQPKSTGEPELRRRKPR